MNDAIAESTFTLPHQPEYEHTQLAPLYWLMLAPVLVLVIVAVILGTDAAAVRGMLLVGGLIVLTAFSFRQLLVRDEGQVLALRFGPIPLFRKRIAYADIAAAERDRSTVMDGWGIHWVPGRGWTYNLWGFDCVRLALKSGRTIRVGTDDPEALARFLQKKCREDGSA
jgi:hypothetical protein